MTQKPAHEIRMGLVKAIIWKNETEKGTRFSTQVVRLYREDDQWRETKSFGRDDLPLVSKLCDLAHSWIYFAAHDEGAGGE